MAVVVVLKDLFKIVPIDFVRFLESKVGGSISEIVSLAGSAVIVIKGSSSLRFGQDQT